MPKKVYSFISSARLRRVGAAVLLAGLLVGLSLAVLYWNVWAKAEGKGGYQCNVLDDDDIVEIDDTDDNPDTIMMMGDQAPTIGNPVTVDKSVTIQGGWLPKDVSAECGGPGADFLFFTTEQAKEFFTYNPTLISDVPTKVANEFSEFLKIQAYNKKITLQQLRLRQKEPIENKYIGIKGTLDGTSGSGSTLTLDKVILENYHYGGGLNLILRNSSTLIISDSQFISNYSSVCCDSNGDYYGGGGFFIEVYDNSQVIIQNSTFSQNSTGGGGNGGGGRIIIHSGQVTVTNSSFVGNDSNYTNGDHGGGLSIEAPGPGPATVWLNNNVFQQNETGGNGDGLNIDGGSNLKVYMTNNLFTGNTAAENNGGVIYIEGNPTVDVVHTTVANPTFIGTQEGIYVNGGTIQITNTIIANHGVGVKQLAGTVVEDYNLYYNYNNNTPFAGTITSLGNSKFEVDPKFVNPTDGEYHLGPDSAALDVALPMGITTDYEGESRPQLGGPDIGADERGPLLNETLKLLSGGGAISASVSIVAVDGDTIVVGRPREDTAAGGDAGAVYILRRSGAGWSQEARLTASDGNAGAWFGFSAAISGDTAVIGAVDDDGAGVNAGAAYIFQRSGTTWSQQAKLTASDAASFDEFGYSVAISGDTVVIGSILDDSNLGTDDVGAAYIFQRSGATWSQQVKLTRSSDLLDRFGYAVAVSGDTAVIGVPFEEGAGVDSGVVYIFQRSGTTWSEQAKLTASDGAAGDAFGGAVSISGETVAIGAYQDDGTNNNAGSVYIFQRSGTTWSEQAKLTARDGAAGDELGRSVKISGDTLVVTTPWEDDSGEASGAVYLFKRSGTTWSQQAKLAASDAAALDAFGYSVAISGERIVVGARGNNASAPGQVYLFGPVGGDVYRLTGKVTNAGGAPLANVRLTTNQGFSTTTSASGFYTFTTLPAGSHTLTPTLAGYTFSPTKRTVNLPPNQTGINFAGSPNVSPKKKVYIPLIIK